MNGQFPNFVQNGWARAALSGAQILLFIGCVAALASGLVGAGAGVIQGDFALIALAIAGAAMGVVLCFALLVVVTTTKAILFGETANEQSDIVIECENGHPVGVTKGQAGSQIACPTCGRLTNVPALSELN